MLKVGPRSPLKPSSSPASTRWPVDETGMNSVRPSTMPSRMTSRIDSPSIRSLSCGGSGDEARLAVEPAARTEAGQPGRRHCCEWSGLDAEGGKALRAFRHDIVRLQHQP